MLHRSQMAAMAVSLPEIHVEGFVFPAVASPPSSGKSLFLGGAGVRGLHIDGKFVKFTAIGVYLEERAVESLAGEWKGKKEEELAGSPDFYRDIVTGRFEKFTQVTMILPLTGQQYSAKVAENCEAYLKSIGAYTEAEAKALEKLKETFVPESFSHASSIFFTHSTSGSLSIAFSKDTSPPAENAAVIENRRVSEAVLESIIGEKGVSPAAKRSLAARLSSILQSCG